MTNADHTKSAAVEAEIALHRRDVLQAAISRVLLYIAIILLLLGTAAATISAYQARETAKTATRTQSAQAAESHATGKQNNAILKSLAQSINNHSKSLAAIATNENAIKKVQEDFVLIIGTSCKAEVAEHAPTADIAECKTLLHKIKTNIQ